MSRGARGLDRVCGLAPCLDIVRWAGAYVRAGPVSGGAREPAPCLVEPTGLVHVRGPPRVWWSLWARACPWAGPVSG